jgi:glycosyltransferase involved in cell wall biosynthesis
MKLVVLAHKPPPMHGQSYMVELLLEAFGGDRRRRDGAAPRSEIECYHVNARLSKNLEDVGGVRVGKLLLLVWHCCQAIWCRFRYDARTLYYVPAPGKRAALYRDWLVMSLCRPFFTRIVFHWHATNLAKWLETSTSKLGRRITYRLMGQVDLSIVLSQYNRLNAEKLWPRRIEIVANGVPDPCPQCETGVVPRRQARVLARRKLAEGKELTAEERAAAGTEPQVIRALFLAHCSSEKGLFDAVHAALLANELLRARHSPLSLELNVAGIFPSVEEKREFERLCGAGPGGTAIRYAGFVQGPQKAQALVDADLLCFPSHWENQPVSVIEALAFGLPMVISRLPSVQEMLPPGYPGVADLRAPDQIAASMLELALYEDFLGLRQHFVTHFTLQSFSTNLDGVLRRLGQEGRGASERESAGSDGP